MLAAAMQSMGPTWWKALCITRFRQTFLVYGKLYICASMPVHGHARKALSNQLFSGPAAAAAPAAASLAARRAAPSALHTRRCPPSRQSACEQAVPQYHTARQALRNRGGGKGE